MKSQRKFEKEEEPTKNINETSQLCSMAMPSLVQRTNAITQRVIESNHGVPQIRPTIPTFSNHVSSEPQWIQQGLLL